MLLLTALPSPRFQHLEGKVSPQLLDFAQPLWAFQILRFLLEFTLRMMI